jgi:hypothetical protein
MVPQMTDPESYGIVFSIEFPVAKYVFSGLGKNGAHLFYICTS